MARKRSRWTTGTFGGRSPELQVLLRREQTSFCPAPVFVFVDEAEDRMDDGHFLVWPAPDTRWVNLPAARHNHSEVLSFADGHVELWKWQAPKRLSPKQRYRNPAVSLQDVQDLRRLQRTTLTAAQTAPRRC